MNDFLQNLRNGNHKRFDNNRKPYNSYNNNRGNERSRGNNALQRTIAKEYWPALKEILGDMASHQKRTADANERKAQAEERKATALESIATYLTGQAAPNMALELEADSQLPPKESESLADAPDAPETPAESSAPADQEKVLGIIREMRQNRISYEKIAAHLTAEGIPPFSGKGEWRRQMVSRIHQENP